LGSVGEAEAVGGGGLDGNDIRGYSEGVGEVLSHLLAMRGNSDPLGDDSCVHVCDGEACCGGHGRRLSQEGQRVGSIEQRIAGWEMLAEIAKNASAQDRVCHGMGEDVAVGGGGQALIVGDLNAAEKEWRFLVESMGIETPANPGCGNRGLRTQLSSSISISGRARSIFLIASSSSTWRLKAISELKVVRALESMRFSAGLMPLVCWA